MLSSLEQNLSRGNLVNMDIFNNKLLLHVYICCHLYKQFFIENQTFSKQKNSKIAMVCYKEQGYDCLTYQFFRIFWLSVQDRSFKWEWGRGLKQISLDQWCNCLSRFKAQHSYCIFQTHRIKLFWIIILVSVVSRNT